MTSEAPLTLGFDTSHAYCAGVLICGETVLAERHEAMAKGQAERLMPMLEEMLAEAGCGWPDLARIGVGVGPGNFTGIRLSVAAARGLALSLGVPAIGVNLFDAAALNATEPVAVAIDARRGALYLQVFGQGLMPDLAPSLLTPADLPDWLRGRNMACLGTGGEALAAEIGGRHRPACYAPASAIARIAAVRTPGPRPAPFYMRSADAAPSRDVAPVILE